jgi:hypothetical protein
MIIKNLRQLFFLFMENRFAKQHSTDPLFRSELVFHMIVPPITPLHNHMVEVFFSTSEVVEDMFVPHESKLCHGILFQLLFYPSRSPHRTSPRYQS